MDQRRIMLEPAYLLHHRPYRDSSQLLALFTRHHGRIDAVAKGIRRGNSRLRAFLQPFQPLLVSWVGRGELVTLTGAEANGNLPPATGKTLLSGFYLNELLLRLLAHGDSQVALFDLYAGTLSHLWGGAPLEATLRIFERDLLDELGFKLNLDTEVASSEPVSPDLWYRFDPEGGPHPLSETPGEAGDWDFPGNALLALARGELQNESHRRYAKRLLRQTLALHLGGRPLKSRDIFRALN
jgi:DNA repair protein RecO (recombination protein O)